MPKQCQVSIRTDKEQLPAGSATTDVKLLDTSGRRLLALESRVTRSKKGSVSSIVSWMIRWIESNYYKLYIHCWGKQVWCRSERAQTHQGLVGQRWWLHLVRDRPCLPGRVLKRLCRSENWRRSKYVNVYILYFFCGMTVWQYYTMLFFIIIMIMIIYLFLQWSFILSNMSTLRLQLPQRSAGRKRSLVK